MSCKYDPEQHIKIQPYFSEFLDTYTPKELKKNIFTYVHKTHNTMVIAYRLEDGTFVDVVNIGTNKVFTKKHANNFRRWAAKMVYNNGRDNSDMISSLKNNYKVRERMMQNVYGDNHDRHMKYIKSK